MLQRVMSRFSVEVFCLTVPKNLAEEPSCAVFQKISGSEKIYGQEGMYQDFASKSFCLTVPEFFVKTFRVSQFSGLEKFHASEGYVTFFCRNFLCHSVEKFCMGTLLCCVSEKFR